MITVNGIEIPQDSIFNEMQYHPSETMEEAQFKAARSLIIDELFRQRAIDLGFLQQNQSLSEVVTDDVLEQDLNYPAADHDYCERYYQQNLDKFKTFPLMAVRHILLKAAPDDIELRSEMQELANGVINQLKDDPEKFSQLAKLYSACPSKETGGQLGQLSKGQTVPEFEEHLVRHNEGLIPTPIESRFGFHIVFIDQKVEGKQLTFDMVKQRIEDYLNEKVKRKAIAQYIAQRINESKIEGIDLGVDERQVMQ